MSGPASGARSGPPDLPGFVYRSDLGAGGFADVYLYEQVRPAREVAIKVLREPTLSGEALHESDAEADLMAAVSAHPHIVSIFDAGVAPDGRPYLVMEFFPGDNFSVRAKGERLPVPQVLKTAIQIAGAVETAHRAGILHRDIKPANILTNTFNQPGLTDFGISVNQALLDNGPRGLSLPWAAPEELADDGAPASPAADVWSLGATVWTLLTGLSPFEIAGDNRPLALSDRIMGAPLRSTGRPEVPPSLERALQQAMTKNPATRCASALEFARELQIVEQEMGLAVTEVFIPTAPERGRSFVPVAPEGDDAEATIYRPHRVVAQPHATADELVTRTRHTRAAQSVPAFIEGHPAVPAGRAGPSAAGFRAAAASALPDTQARSRRVSGPAGDQEPQALVAAPPPAVPTPAPGLRLKLVVVGLLVSAGAAISVAILLLGGNPAVVADSPGTDVPATAQDVGGGATPAPPTGTATRLSATRIRFTWKVPDPGSISGYLIARTDADGAHPETAKASTRTSVVLTGPDGASPCLEVRSVAASGQTSPPQRLCLP